MRFVAVDWSGRHRDEHRYIWLAEADSQGGLLSLSNGRSRLGVAAYLVRLANDERELIVGLDFAFSFPSWFLEEKRLKSVSEIWERVEREGEEWLATCKPPFWGRPGRPRPDCGEPFRRTEKKISESGVGTPKSVFQIGGAGAVGTGSIRGMPLLSVLRGAGYSIWPFDQCSSRVVIEIYPRLLTGKLTKTDGTQRRSCIEASYSRLQKELAEKAMSSDDAFDAAISALEMAKNSEALHQLTQTSDPVEKLEGRIWKPPPS